MYAKKIILKAYQYHRLIKMLNFLLLILTIFIVISFSVVIKANDKETLPIVINDYNQMLILSLEKDFINQTNHLNAKAINEMNNITYTWLDKDLNNKVGVCNQENYICYGFYLKNKDNNDINYLLKINIKEVTKDVDAALRVIIYRNNVETIYAKKSLKKDKYVNTKDFINNHVIALEQYKYAANTVDKFTIVVYIEGEDEDCTNSLIGGTISLSIEFKSISTKEGI